MQLSELLDKLHDLYDRHGDVDVECERDGYASDPEPEYYYIGNEVML